MNELDRVLALEYRDYVHPTTGDKVTAHQSQTFWLKMLINQNLLKSPNQRPPTVNETKEPPT